jgi:hypothetical protein
MDFVVVIGGFTAIAFVIWLFERRSPRGGRSEGGGEAFVTGDSSGDCGSDGGGGDGGGGCD